MTGIDELKDTLRHNIELHERLRDVLKEECVYIEDDTMESLPEKILQKTEIEREIERTNKAVTTLFNDYYRDALNIDSESRNEISFLMTKLCKSIHETVTIIGNTIETVKRTKKEIVNHLKDLDNKKYAINAYFRTNYL